MIVLPTNIKFESLRERACGSTWLKIHMIYEIDLREILPKLKGPLKEIVDMEIAAGNEMVEIASGWPMPEVNIWFSKPLTDKYKEKYPGLKYIYLGDPKNWLEDYRDNENGAMVAAKY